MPQDIKVESLTDDQKVDLDRLKKWLYQQRTSARLERDGAEKTPESRGSQRRAGGDVAVNVRLLAE